jgi:hypothetical protein
MEWLKSIFNVLKQFIESNVQLLDVSDGRPVAYAMLPREMLMWSLSPRATKIAYQRLDHSVSGPQRLDRRSDNRPKACRFSPTHFLGWHPQRIQVMNHVPPLFLRGDGLHGGQRPPKLDLTGSAATLS